jgi:hypothetical protein
MGIDECGTECCLADGMTSADLVEWAEENADNYEEYRGIWEEVEGNQPTSWVGN